MPETHPVETLPRWDMTVVYPSIDSPEFREGFAALQTAIEALADRFDDDGVEAGPPLAVDDALVARFDRVIVALNRVIEDFSTNACYLSSFVATDSRDELAQSRFSELQIAGVALSKLATRWAAWVGRMDVDTLVARSREAAEHAFPLRKTKIAAVHQMPPAEESLAAELDPSGGGAWAKLYDTVTSQIVAPVEIDGQARTLPMSEIRNLALSPDRALRERAFDAEVAAWELWASPLAAALNGIKGQANTLDARRGWDDPLDVACFINNMDRGTLDAMVAESRAAFPDLRRYLKAKARLIGVPELAFFDLFAPVGDADLSWDWLDAVGFLEAQFDGYSPRLGDLLRRAVQERWIDAGPRPGKTDGAYCAHLRGGESRILHNYTPSFDGVSTLAHEMGHAYHNLCEAGLTPLQRETPMTLAETASTFCETIVREAMLETAEGDERLFILDQSLQGSTQVVVDILSRFDFERQVFARRRERELTVSELCGLMRDAQLGTYGDGLDPERLHPWMWAAKGHYYSAGLPFYNFPYLFGLLFGLGLYAQYRREPASFHGRYDRLLASTGLADAATLAAEFGIDIRDGAFWRSSLDMIRQDVDRFVAMVDAR